LRRQEGWVGSDASETVERQGVEKREPSELIQQMGGKKTTENKRKKKLRGTFERKKKAQSEIPMQKTGW